MTFRLRYKIFLVHFGASMLVIALMVVFSRMSFQSGFLAYVEKMELRRLELMSEILGRQYEIAKSWEYLLEEPEKWRHLQYLTARKLRDLISYPGRVGNLPRFEPGVRRHRQDGDNRHGREESHSHGMERRYKKRMKPRFPEVHFEVFLMDREKKNVLLGAGGDAPQKAVRYFKIVASNEIVGWLGLKLDESRVPFDDRAFFRNQSRTFYMVAGGMVVLSILTALFIAYTLEKPITRVTRGTNRLASGDFGFRLSESPKRFRDELDLLTRDFNRLAVTLEKNELDRKKWVADIAHELRTPLTLLSGELEAVTDGIREMNEETVTCLRGDIDYLIRLVDDLSELSRTDLGAMTYKREPIDLVPLLHAVIQRFEGAFEEAGIALSVKAPDTTAVAFADGKRIRQLFRNILQNTLDYTEQPGTAEIRVEKRDRNIRFHFMDSAPGVPTDELPRLFERLFRVEQSRNRKFGGAGLGLAICKNIAEAHEGGISARQSPLGGVWITITLPLV